MGIKDSNGNVFDKIRTTESRLSVLMGRWGRFFWGLAMIVAILCLLDVVAHAQTNDVAPLQHLSLGPVIVAVLSIVTGYLTNAQATGLVFGRVVVPQKWLPWVSLGVSFLGAFLLSIKSAATIDELAWVNAVVSGAVAIGGNVTGITIHQHTKTPGQTIADRTDAVSQRLQSPMIVANDQSKVDTIPPPKAS